MHGPALCNPRVRPRDGPHPGNPLQSACQSTPQTESHARWAPAAVARQADTFLPRGLRAVARAAHRAQPSDPPPRATEQAQAGVWTLAVPRPRAARSCSASVSTRRPGRSVPARSVGMARIARWADFTSTPRFPVHLHVPDALARIHAPIGRAHRVTGGRLSIRRCRGWPIPPEPAGTGRASHVGETAARSHANTEGPQRGSRPPVAGGGACGRSGWGDARPHPATRGTGNTKSRSEKTRTGDRRVGDGGGERPPPHRFMSMSMMAFWTWRRFSASSKITDQLPSATSACTSSPRWHGRQCMKSASLSAVSISSGVTW